MNMRTPDTTCSNKGGSETSRDTGKVDCDPMSEMVRSATPAMGNTMVLEIIAAAGNTEAPAFLTLIKLGYEVDRVGNDGDEHWIATKGTLRLLANGPLELLGLSLLRSERGSDWHASDHDIDQFIKRFYPSVESA